MSTTLVRRLETDELQIVQDLAYATWPDTFKEILSPEQIRYMLDWMYNLETLTKQERLGHQFYVCESDELPVGFIGIEPHHPDQNKLKIHKLYVLPSTQGSGVGKILLQKAISVAKEMGIEKIVLNVNRYNRAVEFYKHLGFTVAYEENIDIGNGYWMEDYVMSYSV
jgi:ribosomal protein S18 acetylase RimI-like enzyme